MNSQIIFSPLIFRLSLISILLWPSLSQANSINIENRIKRQEYYRMVHPILFGENSYTSRSEFIKLFYTLKADKRDEVYQFIGQLQEYLPYKVLAPLVYWRIIKQNSLKTKEIIKFIMFDKILILNNALEAPFFSDKARLKNILHNLTGREWDHLNFLTSLENDLEEKAQLISQIKSQKPFMEALLTTNLITFNLKHLFPEIPPYTLSYLGIIPGNKVQLIRSADRNLKKIHHSQGKKADVIFQKDPILIKIREMLEQAKDSLFINTLSLRNPLREEKLLKYILEKIQKKIKINPHFKVLILHNSHQVTNHPFLFPRDNSQDRSKVMVIDANTNHPMALISSRNWSNSYGEYHYGDAIFIEGPAAALVQSNYREDVRASLERYPARKKEILNWFEIKKKAYPILGHHSVHLAENDLQGVVKNIHNTLVDMIIRAQKHIYMEYFLLYDHAIVDTLIKRKLEVPSLDIKILIDHNKSFGMGGFPNSIFLRELKSYGIQVRARKGHSSNHRKITSVDGQFLFLSSSNLTLSSLRGNTRDFGVQIYHAHEIKKFETSFLQTWNSKDWVMEMDIENFRINLGGQLLDKKTSALFNDIAAQLLRAKDSLEGKN